MTGKALAVYTPQFQDYKFYEEHPFNPVRLQLWYELLDLMGAIDSKDIVFPVPAANEELLLIHDLDYVEAIKEASRGRLPDDPLTYNLGTEDNPVFPKMHQAASLLVGATLKASRLVLEGKADHALNMGGGLHHALPARASGFCVYNDAAVAISWLKREYRLRIMYIDLDAHHGDGVQRAFYHDPEVMTVSFHETGRYLFPGTGSVTERGTEAGLGYSVNIPLEPFTEDESFLEAVETVLPSLVQQFKPDLIVSQHGCDGHELDPLTHLSLTTKSFEAVPKLIHQLAHEFCDGRWLALGGGGYDIWRVVPRTWALLWAEMSGRQLPRDLPERWLVKWDKRSPVPLPKTLYDNPEDFPAKPRRLEINEKNRRTVSLALNRPTWIYLS